MRGEGQPPPQARCGPARRRRGPAPTKRQKNRDACTCRCKTCFERCCNMAHVVHSKDGFVPWDSSTHPTQSTYGPRPNPHGTAMPWYGKHLSPLTSPVRGGGAGTPEEVPPPLYSPVRTVRLRLDLFSHTADSHLAHHTTQWRVSLGEQAISPQGQGVRSRSAPQPTTQQQAQECSRGTVPTFAKPNTRFKSGGTRGLR